jgi:hypothetical protein
MNLTEMIVVFVLAGAGAYLGAYLKSKGSRLATKEDLEGVLREQRYIAQTVEVVRMDIGNKAWTIQQKWEEKNRVKKNRVRLEIVEVL